MTPHCRWLLSHKVPSNLSKNKSFMDTLLSGIIRGFVLFFYFIFKSQLTFNIILYWFQVYSIVAGQLYNLPSDPPYNLSMHLAPYVVITVFCTLFLMLHPTFPVLTADP